MTYEVGRVCVKLAGRDANQKCVVVEKIDDRTVLIDGNTRRRNCNVMHLIATKDVVDIKEKASTGEVKEALSKLGVEVKPVSKPKEAKPKPVSKRAAKSVEKKK